MTFCDNFDTKMWILKNNDPRCGFLSGQFIYNYSTEVCISIAVADIVVLVFFERENFSCPCLVMV